MTDCRSNNIAQSIFAQMAHEPCPVPTWIVCGAGTGGTSATIGRFIRHQRHATRLCVADPQGSVFHRHFHDRSVQELDACATCIEGIGRPRVEPSLIADVVDRMIAVPDESSLGAMLALGRSLGCRCGGSTGTNLWACAKIISEMVGQGERGSVVSLLCDSGERYRSTLHDDAWVRSRKLDVASHEARMARSLEHGTAIE